MLQKQLKYYFMPLLLFATVLLVLRFRKKMNTVEQLNYWLRFAGFSVNTAKILVAQAAFETANFTSPVFLNNNNFFGMKQPKIRRTLATGTALNHATFNSRRDSVNDFALWWSYFNMPREFISISDYVYLIKSKGYFESDAASYIAGMQRYYNQYYG
jgi:hypothetical protein